MNIIRYATCLSAVTLFAIAISVPLAASRAAMMTDEYTVNAFFHAGHGNPPPSFANFTAVFDITFDVTKSYDPTSQGFLLKSSTYDFKRDAYGFEYHSVNSFPGIVQIGVLPDVYENSPGNFTFRFRPGQNFAYAFVETTDDAVYEATGSLSVERLSTVPLPAAYGLFGLGITGLSFLKLRRRDQAV